MACRVALPTLAALLGGVAVQAQNSHFDLLGPKVDVHVTRGGESLPIASVPNLEPGDKLQVHADIPETQSVHLLLVVAFLRGTTNPPPDKWFTRIESWDKKVKREGVQVEVPEGAQQALIFIAPETGGDFSTLKDAVRGRPGTFVRASQDLNQASFEQSRIERYVQAISKVPSDNAEQLVDHSKKLAATLNLKPNEECFKLPVDQQAYCLRQSGTQLLMDDGHGQTLAQILSTGATSDLIGAVASTPAASGGLYSAYVGTVLDVVKLLTNMHTAHFQYIPAIAFPEGDSLNLKLNVAPSFHDPKSVIVIALPAIQSAVPPTLQLRDPGHVSCLLQTKLVLPLSGSPLVFATSFAHDMVLHLDVPGPDGRQDLPLQPDAFEGGLTVASDAGHRALLPEAAKDPAQNKADGIQAKKEPGAQTNKDETGTPSTGEPTAATQAASSDAIETFGTVHGMWGFDRFEGPRLPVQRVPGKNWALQERTEVIAGRANAVMLRATGTACTESVELTGGHAVQRLEWKPATDSADKSGVTQGVAAARPIEVKLPLEKANPGGLQLSVTQYGADKPALIPLTAYSGAINPREVRMHAGDDFLTLMGTGLEVVRGIDVNDAHFVPASDAPPERDALRFIRAKTDIGKAGKARPLSVHAGDRGSAMLTLDDGRSLKVPFEVDSARPSLTLLNVTVHPKPADGVGVVLTNSNAIPLDANVSFALRSESPARFGRSEKIEVSAADGSLHQTLALADGSLVLQDNRTVVGYLHPLEAFGPSTFGPVSLRAIGEDGSVSDWMQLGNLVRLPEIDQVSCAAAKTSGSGTQHEGASANMPAETASAANSDGDGVGHRPDMPCTVSGKSLFLIDAVAQDSALTGSHEVPAGFSADSLPVPRPADGHTLYVRLRDDPDHLATLQVETQDHKRVAAARKSGSGTGISQ